VKYFVTVICNLTVTVETSVISSVLFSYNHRVQNKLSVIFNQTSHLIAINTVHSCVLCPHHNFFIQTTFEESRLNESDVGDKQKWLKEGMDCILLYWNGRVCVIQFSCHCLSGQLNAF
jgi:hypothetical protein